MSRICQEENSQTRYSGSALPCSFRLSHSLRILNPLIPIFPHCIASYPYSCNTWATAALVVVFPFVPVIPMILTCSHQGELNSQAKSLTTMRAYLSMGWFGGMAGFLTTISAHRKSSERCGPEMHSAPRWVRSSISYPRLQVPFKSVILTSSPWSRKYEAAAKPPPCIPRPKIRTFMCHPPDASIVKRKREESK